MNLTLIMIILFIIWNIGGFIVFIALSTSEYHDIANKCFLRPDWVYTNITNNIVKCIVVSILFNLICPILSIVYWIYAFILFISKIIKK